MINMETVQKEIDKLEAEPTCYYGCERLAWLYIVRDHNTRGEIRPLTRAEAEAWVASMRNADPAHPRDHRWTWDQTTALLKEKGLPYSAADWYAVLNMLYSDFGVLLAKHGPKEMDAYVELARAFLDDPDAAPNKTARYYRYIAER